jgi:pimeloyl-ACP methyl ester carboxylesterase
MRGFRQAIAIVVLALATLPAGARAESVVPSVPWGNDFACAPTEAHPRPVVLLHGLGGAGDSNWGYLGPRLQAAGYCVFAVTYGLDPRTRPWPYRPGGTIAAERSAPEIGAFVDRVLSATGASRVDFVGHSEGTVTPRYYLERLGGAPKVKRYVALTPLWRGTELGGAALLRDMAGPELSAPLVTLAADFCGFCPQALRGSAFLDDLNADGEAIPGIRHTNIVTRYDELVVPYTSGLMRDGGRNIVLQKLCPANVSEHGLVAFDPVVARLILNALDPRHAEPVTC